MTIKLMGFSICILGVSALHAMHFGGAGAQAQKPVSMDTGDDETPAGRGRSRSPERSEMSGGQKKRKATASPEHELTVKRQRKEEASLSAGAGTAGRLLEEKGLKEQIEIAQKIINAVLNVTYFGENLDDVKRLVTKDNVNYVNRSGTSPLMVASCRRNLYAVDYLLGMGAKIDQTNNQGDSPITFAIKCYVENMPVSDPDIVHVLQRLIKAGADINVRDAHGETIADYLKLCPCQGGIFCHDVREFLKKIGAKSGSELSGGAGSSGSAGAAGAAWQPKGRYRMNNYNEWPGGMYEGILDENDRVYLMYKEQKQ